MLARPQCAMRLAQNESATSTIVTPRTARLLDSPSSIRRDLRGKSTIVDRRILCGQASAPATLRCRTVAPPDTPPPGFLVGQGPPLRSVSGGVAEGDDIVGQPLVVSVHEVVGHVLREPAGVRDQADGL